MVLSVYLVTHSPTQRFLSFQKGWVFAPLQGHQTLVILFMIWMLSKEELDFNYFSLDPIRIHQKLTPNQGSI